MRDALLPVTDRPRGTRSSRRVPCQGPPAGDVAGRYRSGELDAEVTVVDTGGVLYGGFSGFLGQGRMELLEPVGGDVWALPCPGRPLWPERTRCVELWP